MILPIVAYGDAILRKKAAAIPKEFPPLSAIIADMWDTMYNSHGVGLAAPQINQSIRLFIIDSEQLLKDQEEDSEFIGETGTKRVFINAEKMTTAGEPWVYNEGCLSIPKIREDITRPDDITLKFMDENFVEHIETFSGLTGRIIQHEYDHIEGILFVDYLKPLKKTLLKRKLEDISTGRIKVDYRMKFPRAK